MRGTLLGGGLIIVLLLGCSENQPKAGRGGPKSGGNAANIPGPRATPGGGPGGQIDERDGVVRLDVLTLTAPEGWRRKPVQSSFTLAEFALPGDKGEDTDGRLTVSTAGGSIDANIERWKTQFVGALEKSKQEQTKAAGLTITLVDFAGEFNDQRGPFAPAVKRPGYRMIAAVLPVEGQLYFVKATGPQKTMEMHAEKIKAFVTSVKLTW